MNIWLAALVAAVTALVGWRWRITSIAGPAFAVRTALISQGDRSRRPPAQDLQELERANAALVQQIVARREAEREYGQTFNMASRGMAQIAPECDASCASTSASAISSAMTARNWLGCLARLHPDDRPGFAVLGGGKRPWSTAIFASARMAVIGHAGTASPSATVRGRRCRNLTMEDITQRPAGRIDRPNRDRPCIWRGNTAWGRWPRAGA